MQCLGVDGKLRTAETSTVLRGTTPALMPGLRGIKAIAGSLAYGVALTESGTVMTGGDDAHLQLVRGQNAPETPGVIKESNS